MEGMFSFFFESAFIGALVWGEKRLGSRNHFLAALGVALGSWLSGYFILVALVGGGLAAVFTGLRSGAERRTFLGGCIFIAGLLGGAAVSLFPVILYSTVSPDYSITAYNGSSDAGSLRAATYRWPAAFVLTFAYFAFVRKHYRGRVQMSQDGPY
jgi:cytochrome bd-type quinol oxidase subunit 2